VGTDTPSDSEPIAGRYTLDHIIGAGATAIVHEGRDLVTDQRVAVKLYRPDGAAQHRLQQHREIAALTRLRHPGLVTLHDGGTEPGPDGRAYLVTDLVEGSSLAKRLLDGPLDVRCVRDLTSRLADALAHVHARGFIHRDIKPANILLDHGHQPRLADFGIARALDGTIATATGVVAGTAAYLAPEQVRGAPVEAAADVYALGLVVLEALTGRREYPGTVIESATARLHRRPVVPPGLPWNLTALLGTMTDPDPAGRPTAAAVVTALATAPAPLTPPAPMPAAAPPAEPPGASRTAGPSRRSRLPGKAPVLVAAAVLLVFLLGGVSLFITTARSNVPALPSMGAAPPTSNSEVGGAPTGPAISSTGAVIPPVTAVAASVPIEVGRPASAASVAAYTRTGPITATDAHPSSVEHVGTTGDRETAAAGPTNTNTDGSCNGNCNGKSNANGNGKSNGNGKGVQKDKHGNGSDKKGD
jgi:eukaryotic-like serine/threonine-protein kinase